ncbi:hypothetical protein SAMN05519103_03934 [Rhizobiales bacterium GAS113]|nr:hypothetical protein SAMN05519103_03934 [Rhizobiales bacterium GAS113]
MPNLIQNEQRKLAATFFNNLGVATLATGGLAPLVGAILQSPTFDQTPGPVLAMATVAWLLLALILHWLGTRQLKGLEP